MSEQQQTVIVNVQGPQPVIIKQKPGCLLQVIWFLFIGWWLGALASSLAYIFFILIITIPLGVKIINKMPYLIALRSTEPVISYYGTPDVKQHSLLIRALWFIFVGFWATAIWMAVAYIFCLTLIGMPIGFWMYDKAPAILSLYKSS